jgi:hypothetical protein
MNKQDSAWYLAGSWNTNQTKRFYTVTGKVDLQDEPDISKSKIVPHLEELNLAKDIPFYAEAKKAEADEERRRIAANTQKQTSNKPVTTVATRPATEKTQTPTVTKPVEQNKQVEETLVKTSPKKSEPVAINTKPVEQKEKLPEPAEVLKQPVTKNPEIVSAAVVNETNNKPEEALVTRSKPEEKKPAPATTRKQDEPVKQETVAVVNVNKKQEAPVRQEPAAVVVTNKKQDEPVATLPKETRKPEIITENKPAIASSVAALVHQRKMAMPQEVSFKSDSLLVSLYDNGEIDGDTVSILLNGEVIMAKQGLKASAIKKTIYIQPGDDEVTMVLYAENLGKYPPNTGLLVVYDGEERHQVRFSADLQQNATIIFRRKK